MFVCVSPTGFGIVDHVIFAAVLFLSATIGVYHGFAGGGPKTQEEFFMAGRSMEGYPVSLSMAASFMSAVTVLGTPAEIYRFGAMFSIFAIPYAVVVILTAETFVPVFYRLRITSTYEEEKVEVLNRILSSKADEENINPAFSHIEMNTTDNKEKVEVLNRTPSSTSDEGSFYPAFSHIEMNTTDRTPSLKSIEENFYPAVSDIEMNTTDNKEKEEVLNQIPSSMSDEGNFYPAFSHIKMNTTDNKEKVDGINT